MTARDAATLISVTDRYRLRELNPLPTLVVPAGRVMCCRGRKVLGYCDIDKLAGIRRDTDTVCLAPTDYATVMGDAAKVRR